MSTSIPIAGTNATGGVPEGGALPQYPRRRGVIHRQTFEQTYWHYVTNSMDAGYCKPALLSKHNVIVADYGYHLIPYNNLGVAHSNGSYTRLTNSAQRIKMLKMGYRVSHFTTLSEKTTARQASTVIENTYENRPHAMEWHDHEHTFDSSLSDQPDPTTWSAINEKGLFIDQNSSMTSADPISQADGMLGRAYWILQNNANINFNPGEQFINIYDHANIIAHPDGSSWQHEWINSAPVWMGCGRIGALPWGAFTDSEDAAIAGWGKYGYWPSRRQVALREYYFQNDAFAPSFGGIGAGGFAVAPTEASPSISTCTSHSGDAFSVNPSYAYIKLNPIHGPTAPMTTTAIMLITYFQEVEFEEPLWLYRTPMATNYQNNWSVEYYLFQQQGMYNQRAVVGQNTTLQGKSRAKKRRVEEEDLTSKYDMIDIEDYDNNDPRAAV